MMFEETLYLRDDEADEHALGPVRVALVDGKLVANPTYKQVAASPLELVMAGNEDAILMVESGGKEVSEEQMLEALAFGHERCKELTRRAHL
jgi:polyribonucleotide nucleotidyltransferase